MKNKNLPIELISYVKYEVKSNISSNPNGIQENSSIDFL